MLTDRLYPDDKAAPPETPPVIGDSQRSNKIGCGDEAYIQGWEHLEWPNEPAVLFVPSGKADLITSGGEG
jgi:hypothetical protein